MSFPRTQAAPDRRHMLWALQFLHPEECVLELRAPPDKSNGHTASGYFNDWEALTQAAVRLDRHGAGVYVTLNPVKPELLARCANRVDQYAKRTTKDDDILERRYLVVDVDPIRPAGISATESERHLALDVASKVARWLMDKGWAAPLLADSGNGNHLYYRIQEPNDKTAEELIHNVLRALAHRFNTDRISIDETVYNASRIVKLPGSVARKGDDITERPHRLARLIDVPEE